MTSVAIYCWIKLHILEWPFIVSRPKHHCTLIRLCVQNLCVQNGLDQLVKNWRETNVCFCVYIFVKCSLMRALVLSSAVCLLGVVHGSNSL